METILFLAFITLLVAAIAVGLHRASARDAVQPEQSGGSLSERLPAAPPPAPPRVPTWDERMEAVGIHHASAYEGMGSYGIEVESVKCADGSTRWCPFANYGQEWLGKLFTVSTHDLKLAEKAAPPAETCSDHGPMTRALYEIVKRDGTPVDRQQGWTKPRLLGLYCTACGWLSLARAERSLALGELWTSCDGSIRRLVESMEKPEARRAIQEAKLACLESDLAEADRHRDRLALERHALLSELGQGEPYR